MARVNVYVPDELYERVKRARLNVSELVQQAAVDELRRRERLRALERWGDELAERFGPATPDEIARAEVWAEDIVAAAERARAPAKKRRRSG